MWKFPSRSERQPRVGAGVQLDAPVLRGRRVDRHHHRREALRERRPGDVVLVQRIPARARRLVDELVLDEVHPIVELLLEDRLPGLVVALSAHAQVGLRHRALALEESVDLFADRLHLRPREQAPSDEEALAPIALDLGAGEHPHQQHDPVAGALDVVGAIDVVEAPASVGLQSNGP
jgi:hypothetical protein